MSNLLFVDDFFIEHIIGGGELNNHELILLLEKNNWTVIKKQSHLVNKESLNNIDAIVISNFINLSPQIKETITTGKIPYIIYEHDHKYLKSRNPANYNNFVAPKSEIINVDFYEKARKVFCQTNFHKNIIEKNLPIDNLFNLSGNLWSTEALQLLKTFSSGEKQNKASIMVSSTPHKNTKGAIYYCEKNNIEYELIEPALPNKFFENLSKNKYLVFFPRTPETLSRIVVEARMMNMSLKANGLIGATKEPWFEKKGEELINYFLEKRKEILQAVENAF